MCTLYQMPFSASFRSNSTEIRKRPKNATLCVHFQICLRSDVDRSPFVFSLNPHSIVQELKAFPIFLLCVYIRAAFECNPSGFNRAPGPATSVSKHVYSSLRAYRGTVRNVINLNILFILVKFIQVVSLMINSRGAWGSLVVKALRY
jgi:hypothetical protein